MAVAVAVAPPNSNAITQSSYFGVRVKYIQFKAFYQFDNVYPVYATATATARTIKVVAYNQRRLLCVNLSGPKLLASLEPQRD